MKRDLFLAARRAVIHSLVATALCGVVMVATSQPDDQGPAPTDLTMVGR